MRCGLQATWNKILCLSLAVVSHAQGPWSKLNSRHLDLTDLGVKHYPAGMHRSRYEGSKLIQIEGQQPEQLSTHYPLIIHLSSIHPPLIRSWRFMSRRSHDRTLEMLPHSWPMSQRLVVSLLHLGNAETFKRYEKKIIDRLFELMEDMEFTWISNCPWNFAKWSLNSVEVCEAGAGGQQERTRTWQEREAHSAIHDQPVTPSFFPMGWTRRRTHGKCCCQMMI